MTGIGDGIAVSNQGTVLNGAPDNQLLRRLIIVSFGVHALFILVGPTQLFWSAPSTPQETIIAADIFPDLEMGASKEAALPNAAPAEEVKVEKNILPQLPKQFTVEDKPATESDMAVAEQEKEQVKPEPENDQKEKVDESPEVTKRQTEEATELKKKEALERLMKEQARKEEKFADRTEAPLNKKLAQRKMELENQRNGVSGGGGVSEIRLNKYLSALATVVRRNYALPEIYNLKDSTLEVRIAMMLTDSGELRKLDVAQSSGNESFDALALKVIRDSAPLPRPPVELAGQTFVFVFSPKTM
jgi:protein TonB